MHASSTPDPTNQSSLSQAKWDTKLRFGVFGFFLGGVLGLWILSLTERFFPLGFSRLQALLLCILYVPGVVLWLVWRRPPHTKDNHSLPQWGSVALALAVFGMWAACYYSIGLLTLSISNRSLTTALDRAIPLLPWTGFIYATVQWFMVAAIVLIAGVFRWQTILKAYGTVVVGCGLCFAFFPVSIHPPVLPVTDLSTWVISLIRGGDIANNCFPSSHCAMALLSALLLFHIRKLYGWLGMVSAIAIAITTTTTKQHYIADVVGGFALAIGAYLYWFRKRSL